MENLGGKILENLGRKLSGNSAKGEKVVVHIGEKVEGKFWAKIWRKI